MVKTQAKKAAKAKPAKLKGELIASGSGRKPGTKRAKSGRGEESGSGAGDAFLHFLQSPLVADLLAVAATAALAALAEQRFGGQGSGQSSRKKAAGKAVKAAGAAAAAAIGRRLSEEIEEIKKASKAKQAA